MKRIPFSKFDCVGSLIVSAEKHGIKVQVLDKDLQFMGFSKGKTKIYVKQHVVDINSHMASIICRNKLLTKKVLEKNGIPVPAGSRCSDFGDVVKKIDSKKLKFPLVVKPMGGSQGEAVTVDIKDVKYLESAIKEVQRCDKQKKGKLNFLVEEYVKGDDFRFLMLDGKTLTAMLRKPAYVTGDGKMTVKELIDEYNEQPGVAKKQPLCPIVKDYELRKNLSDQNIGEDDLVKNKEVIQLRKNANISTGGRSFECFEKVHPNYLKLMEKIVKVVNIRFCAVDIIAEDISKYEKFKIVEINDTPGFDIHADPFEGKPFDVADALMKSLFRAA